MKSDQFYGGKLIGVDGGGFFLMISKDKKKAEKYLKLINVNYTNFKIDNSGSRIIESF